jgi:2-polyprenyl-6-methoxyphenol hydroxylase-like FAD-dependent oxidoreductase
MAQLSRSTSVHRPASGGHGTHAVVVGAGMAGLLAARVLANHFERVTIVDRDRVPDGPRFRPGVPQSRHLHVLLSRGLECLERLFPGFEAALVAAGVPVVEGSESLWMNAAGWCRRYQSPIRLLGASRELIEWHARTRITGLDNVRLLEGCGAVGLLVDPDLGAVTGVRLRSRTGRVEGTGGDTEVPAEFVVDASGEDPGPRSGWPPSATSHPPRPASTPCSATPAASTGSRPGSEPTGACS